MSRASGDPGQSRSAPAPFWGQNVKIIDGRNGYNFFMCVSIISESGKALACVCVACACVCHSPAPPPSHWLRWRVRAPPLAGGGGGGRGQRGVKERRRRGASFEAPRTRPRSSAAPRTPAHPAHPSPGAGGAPEDFQRLL